VRFAPFHRYLLAPAVGVGSALLLASCVTSSTPVNPLNESGPSVGTHRKTFHFTGGKQTFTVPAGVTKITIVADGASGANAGGVYAGGHGGMVTALIPVTPHELMAVYVGGSGSDGGFNGGGSSFGSGTYLSGAGGGASDVRVGRLGARLVVAAGGGGAGAPSGYTSYGSRGSPPPTESPTPDSTNYANGGDGGGSTGGDGLAGGENYDAKGGGGGAGGTRTTGGIGGKGGHGGSCSADAGADGRRYKGGGGGGGCWSGGGGGGGGLYGGGGGGASSGRCGETYYGEYSYCAWGGGGGGAGGSSFAEKSAIKVRDVKGGAPLGDGLVEISW
jgi:hypothetical protein